MTDQKATHNNFSKAKRSCHQVWHGMARACSHSEHERIDKLFGIHTIWIISHNRI